jgi:radical SAM protein with 4Fe4S-binding SPASM domain
VIDPETDAETVTDYLLSFEPIGIDFLLPLDNHDRRPAGKESLDATPYGDWLVRAYDRWMSRPNSTRIRIFQSIINMMCGGFSLVESIGLRPVDLIVVESNGEIQAVDSLKTTFQGATELGFHIDRDSFDTVAAHFGVRSRQLGALSLSKQCRQCELVDICGGGYLPHRYSADRGFDNPSVYCADLKVIIRHINAEISAAVSPIIAESTMRAAANGFSSSAGMERAHEPLIALATEMLAEIPTATVVDLGCGDGALVSHVAAATGATPYGIELVPERARAADRLLRQAGGTALAGNLYTADWPLPAQHVDLALIALSALAGAPPELRYRLEDTLATHAARTIVYAYDDDLARYGSLLEMARAANVTLTGPVNGGLASEAVLPVSAVPG